MYPDEGERALPPLTSLTVLESRVEGGCLLLALQPCLPPLDEDVDFAVHVAAQGAEAAAGESLPHAAEPQLGWPVSHSS